MDQGLPRHKVVPHFAGKNTPEEIFAARWSRRGPLSSGLLAKIRFFEARDQYWTDFKSPSFDVLNHAGEA
jgi:hypothetical protein